MAVLDSVVLQLCVKVLLGLLLVVHGAAMPCTPPYTTSCLCLYLVEYAVSS